MRVSIQRTRDFAESHGIRTVLALEREADYDRFRDTMRNATVAKILVTLHA